MVESGSSLMNGMSRVTGDCHARICEWLGVRFPGPTRRQSVFAQIDSEGSIADSLNC